MASFRTLCFGQLTLARDGTPLAPGAVQPRRLALLAVLASGGDRATSREKICGLLWPDSDEEKSRRSLAQALYALRRDLGSEEVIEGARELRLNPELVSTDLGDFERFRAEGQLERAAACYAGPFLDGFQLAGLPDFERWVEEERTSWASRHRQVVETLAADADARRDHQAAVTWWRRALAHDLHNARLTIKLMRALARSGDRTAALRQAEIYETLVRADLDLAPDPAVLAESTSIRETPTSVQVTAETSVVKRDEIQHRDGEQRDETQRDGIQRDEILRDEGRRDGRRRERLAPASRLPRVPMLLAGAAAVLVAIVALTRDREEAATPTATANRVLVVPPRNATGDPSFDLVGAMAAEWITNGLVQTGWVDVIDSRSMLSATAPSESEASVNDFAAGAGVGTLVKGSVFRDGDQLRFNIEIVEARTGTLRRSIDPVSAPVGHPTEALEPLRQNVIGALAVLFDNRAHNQAATTSQPPTWEAYKEFLLGMRAFGSDYPASIAHFHRAVALDSTYWQAALWAGIGESNMRQYPEADSIFKSLEPQRQRLGQYDQATQDYFQQGFVEGNWEGSYQGARRMVEQAPGAGHALYALGTTATFTLRTTEAVATLRKIDITRGWGVPWALRIQNLLCRAEHQAGQHAEELADARRMREIDETVGWARVPEVVALAALRRHDELARRVDLAMTLPVTTDTWEPFSPGDMLLTVALELRAHDDEGAARAYLQRSRDWYASLDPAERELVQNRRGLARTLYASGARTEAASLYADLRAADSSSVDYLAGLALIAAHDGDSTEARRVLRLLQDDRLRYRFGAPTLWAARIAAALGRRDEAVALARRAIGEGFARVYLLHSDPDLASLRDYPPFIELLRPRG